MPDILQTLVCRKAWQLHVLKKFVKQPTGEKKWSYISLLLHQNDQNLMHLKVKPCGLFVCDSILYFGASPDGLNRKDSLIVVNCLNLQWKKWKKMRQECFKFLTVESILTLVLPIFFFRKVNWHMCCWIVFIDQKSSSSSYSWK